MEVKSLLKLPSNMLTHGILLSPAPCSGLILGPVCLVHMSNFWHQGVIWVWVRQEGTNGEQHLKNQKITLPTYLKNGDDRSLAKTVMISLSKVKVKQTLLRKKSVLKKW